MSLSACLVKVGGDTLSYSVQLQCTMKITVIISIMLIAQVSASFYDMFQGAVLSVQSSVGKLFTDVVTDVKDTVDCTILAVEHVLSISQDATTRYYEKCAKNETSAVTEQPKVRTLPAVEISISNNEEILKKEIPEEIDARINATLIKLLSGYNPHSKIEAVEKELAKETARLANISELVNQELEKLSNDIHFDFSKREHNNSKPSVDSILEQLKLLETIGQNLRNTSEANSVHNIIDGVLHKLNAIEASEASENAKVERILKDLEKNSNSSYTDLKQQINALKDEQARHLALLKSGVEDHEKSPEHLQFIENNKTLDIQPNSTVNYINYYSSTTEVNELPLRIPANAHKDSEETSISNVSYGLAQSSVIPLNVTTVNLMHVTVSSTTERPASTEKDTRVTTNSTILLENKSNPYVDITPEITRTARLEPTSTKPGDDTTPSTSTTVRILVTKELPLLSSQSFSAKQSFSSTSESASTNQLSLSTTASPSIKQSSSSTKSSSTILYSSMTKSPSTEQSPSLTKSPNTKRLSSTTKTFSTTQSSLATTKLYTTKQSTSPTTSPNIKQSSSTTKSSSTKQSSPTTKLPSTKHLLSTMKSLSTTPLSLSMTKFSSTKQSTSTTTSPNIKQLSSTTKSLNTIQSSLSTTTTPNIKQSSSTTTTKLSSTKQSSPSTKLSSTKQSSPSTKLSSTKQLSFTTKLPSTKQSTSSTTTSSNIKYLSSTSKSFSSKQSSSTTKSSSSKQSSLSTTKSPSTKQSSTTTKSPSIKLSPSSIESPSSTQSLISMTKLPTTKQSLSLTTELHSTKHTLSSATESSTTTYTPTPTSESTVRTTEQPESTTVSGKLNMDDTIPTQTTITQNQIMTSTTSKIMKPILDANELFRSTIQLVNEQTSTNSVQTTDVTTSITPTAITKNSYVNENDHMHTIEPPITTEPYISTTITTTSMAPKHTPKHYLKKPLRTTTALVTIITPAEDSVISTTISPTTTVSKIHDQSRGSRVHISNHDDSDIAETTTPAIKNTHKKERKQHSHKHTTSTTKESTHSTHRPTDPVPSLNDFLSYVDRVVSSSTPLSNTETTVRTVQEPSTTIPPVHKLAVPPPKLKNVLLSPINTGLLPPSGFVQPLNVSHVHSNNLSLARMNRLSPPKPILPPSSLFEPQAAYNNPSITSSNPTMPMHSELPPPPRLIPPQSFKPTPPLLQLNSPPDSFKRPHMALSEGSISSTTLKPVTTPKINSLASFFGLPSKENAHDRAVKEARKLIAESERSRRIIDSVFKMKGKRTFGFPSSFNFGK